MMDFGFRQLWTCDECPIVCEFNSRLRFAEEKDLFEYFGLFDHCGCEKIDGKFYMWDGCGDAWAMAPAHKSSGKRKTGRAYRREKRVQKTERKKNIARNSLFAPMYVGMDRTGMPTNQEWMLYRYGIDDDSVDHTYIKYAKNSNRKTWLKRQANKKFRRTKEIGSGKRWHKKTFDLMWELW